jgi:hypothetical protein
VLEGLGGRLVDPRVTNPPTTDPRKPGPPHPSQLGNSDKDAVIKHYAAWSRLSRPRLDKFPTETIRSSVGTLLKNVQPPIDSG